MRILLSGTMALSLIGCAAAPGPDAAAECAAQGHQPRTEAWRICVQAGGAAIATGPGSPYVNADKESEPD